MTSVLSYGILMMYVFSATKDEKEELTQQILEDKQKLSHDIFTLTKGLQEVPDTENVCELKSVIELSRKIK